MSFPESGAGGAAVEVDRKKTRFLRIYLGCLAAAGAGVCVATAILGWGFWGWFGGIFLLVAGAGGLGGMMKTGGAGKVTCPACLKSIPLLQIKEERTIACPTCGTYLEGSTEMRRVPADRVSQHAAFETPLPASFRWPEGCPVCRGPVTGMVTVEGMSTAGAMALIAAPVAVARVSKVDAPCCGEHKDGVALRRQGSETIIAFRSFRYREEFRALNGTSDLAASGGR